MSGGALGVRALQGSAFDVKGASLFCADSAVNREVLAFHLNTHVASYLTRAISQNLELHVGYLSQLPVPESWAPDSARVASWAVSAKGQLVGHAAFKWC